MGAAVSNRDSRQAAPAHPMRTGVSDREEFSLQPKPRSHTPSKRLKFRGVVVFMRSLLPMDAKQLLQRMCDRHNLPLNLGLSLLPLLERALISETIVRDRILVLTDEALAHGVKHPEDDLLEVVQQELDQDVLKTLARTLHTWEPEPEALLTLDIPKEFLPDDLFDESDDDEGKEAA
ncbi:MAG: hypothetical protein CMJ86_05860 [Planctomycetes bacterium]|nr:hypothetical protein [Planctomycetota bacterium]